MTTLEIIKLIQEQSDASIKTAISELIDNKSAKDTQYKKLTAEYKGQVKILDRVRPPSVPEYKALNKISSGLRGLFVSQGVTYSLGKGSKINTRDEKTFDVIKEFRENNLMHSKDIELLTRGGICGVSGRLIYVTSEAKFKVKNLESWEYLIVKDATTGLAQYGLIYYPKVLYAGTEAEKTVLKVELYDNSKIDFFIKDGTDIYRDGEEKPKLHGFDYVPIIQYENHKRQGDFYEEAPLIDSYDLLLSIEQDELEDLRTSYMVFSGVEPTPEQMENAKFTGAFGSDDPDFNVKYLEKTANAERIKSQLERLRKDAFTSANRVDFRDDKSTAQSGYARILELQTLEDDCTLKRIEMQKVSSNMYQIVASGYAKMRETIEWETIRTEYSNNLPVDLLYYADFTQKTYGKLPLLDIYRQIPFIEDADASVKLFNKEASGMDEII